MPCVASGSSKVLGRGIRYEVLIYRVQSQESLEALLAERAKGIGQVILCGMDGGVLMD